MCPSSFWSQIEQFWSFAKKVLALLLFIVEMFIYLDIPKTKKQHENESSNSHPVYPRSPNAH
jgi:hypothetical protein